MQEDVEKYANGRKKGRHIMSRIEDLLKSLDSHVDQIRDAVLVAEPEVPANEAWCLSVEYMEPDEDSPVPYALLYMGDPFSVQDEWLELKIPKEAAEWLLKNCDYHSTPGVFSNTQYVLKR